MLEQLLIMAKGMNNRFPEGNKPYEIMTRLLEDEVAQSVESAIQRLTEEGRIV